MPNRFARALLAVAALSFAAPASAYWDYGHETVARIALMQVRLRTRLRLAALLRHQDLLGTPECPAHTLPEAAVWADCIKPLKDESGKSRFGYAYNWHFQDVDVCKPFDLATPCAKGDCVSVQIERQKQRLADRTQSLADRVQALAFLTHLVGDLSQPLHAGEHEDQGGNKVAASYGIIAGRNNLHSIWDGYLAERAISSPPGGALGILWKSSRTQRRSLAAGSIEDWSRDSWRISRDAAYGSVFADPCADHANERPVVDEAMLRRLIPVARRQVLAGGVRLARLLDEALG